MNKLQSSLTLGTIIAVTIGGLYFFRNIQFFGIPDIYGDDPKIEKTTNDPIQYYAVVYLKFKSAVNQQDDPIIESRNAYFSATDPLFTISKAIDVVKSNNVTGGGGLPIPYKEKIYSNFSNFGFWNKQKIYVYIDNSKIQFNTKTPLSFTKFGYNDNVTTGASPTKQPNYTFYNANISNPKILTLDNLYLDEAGQPMPPNNPVKKTNLSMNLNFLICRYDLSSCDFNDSSQVLPFIIDPDTGNGLGNKPN